MACFDVENMYHVIQQARPVIPTMEVYGKAVIDSRVLLKQ